MKDSLVPPNLPLYTARDGWCPGIGCAWVSGLLMNSYSGFFPLHCWVHCSCCIACVLFQASPEDKSAVFLQTYLCCPSALKRFIFRKLQQGDGMVLSHWRGRKLRHAKNRVESLLISCANLRYISLDSFWSTLGVCVQTYNVSRAVLWFRLPGFQLSTRIMRIRSSGWSLFES